MWNELFARQNIFLGAIFLIKFIIASMLKVLRIKYIKDYVIWVSLSDGSKGNVDLADFIESDLKDILNFVKVRLDTNLGTIVWPNNKTFSPEFLKEHIVRINLG